MLLAAASVAGLHSGEGEKPEPDWFHLIRSRQLPNVTKCL